MDAEEGFVSVTRGVPSRSTRLEQQQQQWLDEIEAIILNALETPLNELQRLSPERESRRENAASKLALDLFLERGPAEISQ